MIRLELPHIQFLNSYVEGMKEFHKEGLYSDSELDELLKDPQKRVQSLLDMKEGKNLKEGWVPCSEWWLITDNDEFAGRISLRHELNDFLKCYGGHIGYEVVPRFRKQGYAKFAMGESLKEAKKLGLKKVLVTCDDTNIPSIKIIEFWGGKDFDLYQNDFKEVPTRRYWIDVI